MKKLLWISFSLKSLHFYCFLLALCLAFGCNKESGEKSCETVVNADGPAFIKVINERSETVEVYLGDFIPFGAELRAGHCEIYGIPVRNGAAEISTLDGSKSRDVQVNAQAGQTTTITVGADFF